MSVELSNVPDRVEPEGYVHATLIGVAALFEAEYLVEIDATAVLT